MTEQRTTNCEISAEFSKLHNDLDRLEAMSANFVAAFTKARTTSASLSAAAARTSDSDWPNDLDANARLATIANRVSNRLVYFPNMAAASPC